MKQQRQGSGKAVKHECAASDMADNSDLATPVSAGVKVRLVLGDVASVDTPALLVALERAKENGLDYERTTIVKEGLANQTLISGQADIGIDTPYSVIQKSKAPLRNFFQLSKLVFFLIVEHKYQTRKDLDGESITFGKRSCVPGSENRIVAML